MPFCPKCGTEYRAGFEKCADCGEYLVHSLEKAAPKDDEPYAPLTRRAKPYEARMICEALQEAGIPCVVQGAETREVFSSAIGAPIFGSDGLYDAALEVPQSRLAEAQEIVDAFFSETEGDQEVEFVECSECGCPVDPEDEACPACGEKLTE